ncbi:hypothetical protein [Spiroplasma cantharicola]|uniref:Uncharacterized protein n=1 Tax=Spiroplasma cantharicola TaxID=362837 RepID=A0A0M5KCC1_9MOLU|nr:hypothetical protein [Spiroplasma cantharicola]ALD66269.1 hypothetical protein SCANT_v1c03590 [Spiroplasma cantharicola]
MATAKTTTGKSTTAKKAGVKSTSAKKATAKKPKLSAVKKAASNKMRPEHIQTRKKASDPKPEKIINKDIKLNDSQQKFIWEKSDPVSATNSSIYRQDIAGAIIKVSEYGQASEFGWVYALIDQDGERDDVNNVVALHWMNAKVKRKLDENWVAVVTGGRDISGLFNQKKEVKIAGNQLGKTKKTVLFQPSIVEPRKVNIKIRSAVGKK